MLNNAITLSPWGGLLKSTTQITIKQLYWLLLILTCFCILLNQSPVVKFVTCAYFRGLKYVRLFYEGFIWGVAYLIVIRIGWTPIRRWASLEHCDMIEYCEILNICTGFAWIRNYILQCFVQILSNLGYKPWTYIQTSLSTLWWAYVC